MHAKDTQQIIKKNRPKWHLDPISALDRLQHQVLTIKHEVGTLDETPFWLKVQYQAV